MKPSGPRVHIHVTSSIIDAQNTILAARLSQKTMARQAISRSLSERSKITRRSAIDISEGGGLLSWSMRIASYGRRVLTALEMVRRWDTARALKGKETHARSCSS